MDGGVAGVVLTWGLVMNGIQYQHSDKQKYDDYMNAARMSWEATYRETGLKTRVDRRLKDLERRYVPKPVLKYGSATAIVIKVIVEEKLVLTWDF